MKSKINRQYVLDFAKELLTTPSPSGFCYGIMQKIEDEAKRLGYPFEMTRKGAGVITVPGQDDSYVIGLSGHVDTLGAMVRSIKSTGRLRFTSIGGYMYSTVEGEYCLVHTRDGRTYEGTVLTTEPSVHVYSNARDQKREESSMEVRLDEMVTSKDDVVNLGIGVGDFISFDPRTVIRDNGFIKSRHLDDKAGVAILFGLIEMFKREGLTPKHTLKIVISTYEEVGHGASYIPQDIDEMIAVDMGAMGDDLTCTEQAVSICAKDSSGPYDYLMTSRLIELAKRDELNYAVDIYPQYGSDVSAALRAEQYPGSIDWPWRTCISRDGADHIDGLLNSIALLAAYTLE